MSLIMDTDKHTLKKEICNFGKNAEAYDDISELTKNFCGPWNKYLVNNFCKFIKFILTTVKH